MASTGEGAPQGGLLSTMDKLAKSDYYTTPESEAHDPELEAHEDTSTSALPYFSARIQSIIERGSTESGINTTIEDSKAHWSELQDASDESEEVAEIANEEAFATLQANPYWGHFFERFGEDELVLGEKIAEGAQGEIFNVDWLGSGCFVLKVFKKGSFLKDLQRQWPMGLLHIQGTRAMFHANQFNCKIICGTLLNDGRFGFLMVKEEGDLRTLIDQRMLQNRHQGPPFLTEEGLQYMLCIAHAMRYLHEKDIIHRDLKAANVLVRNDHPVKCCVADFECSNGVVGTGFFRAPEILQAIKDRAVKPELFTKAGDVYSYGMVCYEILTGKLPFEGHRLNDYDHVLVHGNKVVLPNHIDDWLRTLLCRCWEFNPSARPSFEEICEGFKKYDHEDLKKYM